MLSHIDRFKHLPLLGTDAHEVVLPEMARQRAMAMQRDQNPRISSVAITMFPEAGETHLLLIKRQSYKGVHSGQIAFPGGKQEVQDGSLESTARREMKEEIGIPTGLPNLVRALSEVYIPPSRFLVHPFVFYINALPNLVKQEREVSQVLKVPLSLILDDDSIQFGGIKMSNGMRIKSPYFNFDGHQIWGATAMMLSELRHMIKQLKV
ncbi:MAG: CoA pyrophosphatase [Salibacteraceae bacterium]